MMKQLKRKNQIAGIICIVLAIVGLIAPSNYLNTLIHFPAFVVLGIGLLLGNKATIIVGTIFGLLGSLWEFVDITEPVYYAYNGYNRTFFEKIDALVWGMSYFIEVLAFAALLMGVILKKKNYLICLIGTVLATFSAVFCLYDFFANGLTFVDCLIWITLAVIILLTGASVEYGFTARKRKNCPVSQPSPVSGQYEHLSKLKELLDMGAITQEEFDEKKKKILGM